MKYQIKLNNGAVILCDTYQTLKKGIAYTNGTLEVYMKEDMYDLNSITRVRVSKHK